MKKNWIYSKWCFALACALLMGVATSCGDDDGEGSGTGTGQQPTLPDLPEEPDFSGLPVHEDDAPADFLYPGVTDGMVHVSTAGQVREAQVYDLQGKLRQRTDRPVIDLSGCADGLYIVALVTTEGRSVHRIVKR